MFRVYIADCAKVIVENTAKWAGGSVMTKSYLEFINPPKYEDKSADDIIADIVERAGLVVV